MFSCVPADYLGGGFNSKAFRFRFKPASVKMSLPQTDDCHLLGAVCTCTRHPLTAVVLIHVAKPTKPPLEVPP